ncbi:MAG TPA: tetratricopeptide repeat protein [Chitinophagaceae bacterium]|nr:tetratricopeptide repeat protein [Chitinophagaceae bacterium]
MLPLRTILILAVSTILAISSNAQHHPNRIKMDSLRKHLPVTKGIERIDCLNALAEEFWWWQFYSGLSDSVSRWAIPANKESREINYSLGWATSLMHLGVADLYRKNSITAEKYFRQALQEFEKLNNDKGIGWCSAWLAEDLYSQMEFNESMNYYNKAVSYFEKTNDWEGKGKAWAWMGSLYATIGDYDKGVSFAIKSLSIREQMSDHICVARSLNSMGNFYGDVGAHEEALTYYQKTRSYADKHSLDYRFAHRNFLFESLGSLYRTMNKPDSSLFYLQKALETDPGNLTTRIAIGETFLLKKQYDSALQIFLKPIEPFRRENDKWDLMRVLLDAAKAHAGKGNNMSALSYAYESLSIARTADVRPVIIENYSLLATLYSNLSQSDSAYYYLNLATTLKNELTKTRYLFILSDYKKQAEYNAQRERIASLYKHNKALDQANKSKEEQLKQASMLKWVFAAGLFVALLAALFIYRSLTLKRKNEQLENQKTQSDLKLKASELEMQALRAQMNPHFIFNCLSSINHFILKNETDAASDYLTKFSRLIRIVLINSKNKLIILEDELEMLRLYLDMERLRFKNSFNYKINFINSIDIDNIYIPPLLLQPFAENAIWHGLMNKDGEGHLEISLCTENDFLICHIIDDGIGRKAAAELKISDENKKSLGLKITRERFDLLNETDEKKTFFEFEDLFDENGNAAGTKVMLKIRIREASYSLT